MEISVTRMVERRKMILKYIEKRSTRIIPLNWFPTIPALSIPTDTHNAIALPIMVTQARIDFWIDLNRSKTITMTKVRTMTNSGISICQLMDGTVIYLLRI
jgi:hypothetical protein